MQQFLNQKEDIVQEAVDRIGHCAFAAAAQPGEPDDRSFVAVESLTLFSRDTVFVPGDVR